MCQFLCCDCWWFNCCGVLCGGWHDAYCVCSFWLFKPAELSNIDPDCCHICAFDGLGGNFCCWGNVCCAPESVKQWSRSVSGGGAGNQQVIIVNNNYSWLKHLFIYHKLSSINPYIFTFYNFLLRLNICRIYLDHYPMWIWLTIS